MNFIVLSIILNLSIELDEYIFKIDWIEERKTSKIYEQ